jgi:hypothetical protein
MRVDDSPAPAHLDDALELAEILRPTWSAISEENRKTARFLNEGEEGAKTDGDQPSPDDADSQVENNGDDAGDEASFLDAYDLGEVTDPQARATAEAYIKRVGAGYTRQRQQDTQAVRKAKEAEAILDGLLDPERQTGVAQALGLTLAQAEALTDDFADEFVDPNDRIDALEQQLSQQQEVTAAERRAQAENAYVTEQVQTLESKLGAEFVDEEVEALYLFADENRDEKGAPDVEAANRLLDAVVAARMARASKPRPRAPRRPGQGSAGERQVDLDDPEKRLEAGLAAARSVLASSE